MWNIDRDACQCPVHRGRDLLQSESNKVRLLSELDCLEEMIVSRQQDLEEILQRHKTDLAAVQMEVLNTLPFISQSYCTLDLKDTLLNVRLNYTKILLFHDVCSN